MPAREPLICPNWCPFVQGDILSQIWSLHSAAAHVSSTIYNLVTLFEQGQNFALQRDVWFYLGKKITSWCRRVWVELSFAISLVCSVIITFFMGFMTNFNLFQDHLFHCFYEQAYLHMWAANLSKPAFFCSPKAYPSTTNLKQKYFAYGWLWIRSFSDNEDKCLVADFLGCPFLTTSGPLELESVMSSCWICSSRRALHTPEQVQWAGTTSLH